MTFRFIDAVQRLVPNFTKPEWSKLYEKVGARLHLNQLKKTFVILSDDERPQYSTSVLSGTNALPISGGGRGRGAPAPRGAGRGGNRKRVAESDTVLPTPSKSARGRN